MRDLDLMNASTFQQPKMLQYLHGIPGLLRQPYYNSTGFAHAADKFKSRRDTWRETASSMYISHPLILLVYITAIQTVDLARSSTSKTPAVWDVHRRRVLISSQDDMNGRNLRNPDQILLNPTRSSRK
jgi:hypothetical protein